MVLGFLLFRSCSSGDDSHVSIELPSDFGVFGSEMRNMVKIVSITLAYRLRQRYVNVVLYLN